jgi:serine/threonine-protein kinase
MSEGLTERLEAALDGKYRIERKLGEGGMASVYLAEDIKHQRKVALKILRPELAAVIGAERFLSEIRTTANLQHPHILALFDSGEAGGYLYYVMPYIEGETLREKLDREKQLGVEEAVRIARDVADALDYAHRAGVIHRDIKPANILLHDGRPVVADFGIALAVSAAGGGRMTETGLSLGTPHYMSPEQASADRDLSARSDVYSLGCVLYEMIGGQPPHTGPSAQSILVHILTKEATPLTELRHTVPPHVAATVAKSIEKLPADRFETAKAFMEALGDESFRYRTKLQPEAVLEPITGSGTARPWLRDYRSVAALLVALGMTAVAVSAPFSPSPQPAPATRSVLSLGAIDPGPEDDVLVSPDGSRFAVAGEFEGQGERALFWRSAAEESFRVLPGTEGAGDGAAFSPDGDWLVYVMGQVDEDDGLFKVSLLGGAPTPVVPPGLSNPRDPSWGDDGSIVFVSDAGLHRVPDAGGESALFGEPGLATPSVLPDGGGVIAGRDGGGIMLLDPDSDSIRELLPGGFDPKYVETGHILYVDEAGGLWAFPFDVDRSEVVGAPAPIMDGLSIYSRGTQRRYARLSVSRSGTLAYGAGAGTVTTGLGLPLQLVVVDLEGNEEAVTLGPRDIDAVSWSPDGESVVFSSSPLGSSENQIYTYNVTLNTAPRQITFEGDNDNPVFSPDGTRVAFNSAREGTDGYDLFVKNLNDNSPPLSIITLEAHQLVTQWPSDSLIVFERDADGNRDLWTVDLSDPDNPRARDYLTSEADLRFMVVSPDGTLAAYSSDESGQDEVYIRGFPEPGAPTIVSEGGSFSVPFWSPDGNTLFYFGGRGGDLRLMAAHVERSPVPAVVSTEEVFSFQVAARPFQGSGLHPDGDRFILARIVTAEARGSTGSERFLVVTNWFTELCERMGGC